jgi:hypothetical protein
MPPIPTTPEPIKWLGRGVSSSSSSWRSPTSSGDQNLTNRRVPLRQTLSEIMTIQSSPTTIDLVKHPICLRVIFRLLRLSSRMKSWPVADFRHVPGCAATVGRRRWCSGNHLLAALPQLSSSLFPCSKGVSKSSWKPSNCQLRRSPALIWGQSNTLTASPPTWHWPGPWPTGQSIDWFFCLRGCWLSLDPTCQCLRLGTGSVQKGFSLI